MIFFKVNRQNTCTNKLAGDLSTYKLRSFVEGHLKSTRDTRIWRLNLVGPRLARVSQAFLISDVGTISSLSRPSREPIVCIRCDRVRHALDLLCLVWVDLFYS